MPAQGSTTAKLSHRPLWICTCPTGSWMNDTALFAVLGPFLFIFRSKKWHQHLPPWSTLKITRTVSTNSFPCHSFLHILRRILPLCLPTVVLLSPFSLPISSFPPVLSVIDPFLSFFLSFFFTLPFLPSLLVAHLRRCSCRQWVHHTILPVLRLLPWEARVVFTPATRLPTV